MHLLSVDFRIVRFLELLFQLIVLNLLTLLCCLPIITTGAALTALYHSLFDMREGKGNIFKGYFRALKENIRPALMLGIVFAAVCVSFVFYALFLRDLLAAGNVLAWLGVIAVGAFFFFPMTYAFPLLSKFDSPAVRTLLNAYLLSVRHIGTTIAVLLMNALPWLLLLINPSWLLATLPVWLFFGFALPAWFASGLFLRVFKKYAEL